jgi:hypothetical protein
MLAYMQCAEMYVSSGFRLAYSGVRHFARSNELYEPRHLQKGGNCERATSMLSGLGAYDCEESDQGTSMLEMLGAAELRVRVGVTFSPKELDKSTTPIGSHMSPY